MMLDGMALVRSIELIVAHGDTKRLVMLESRSLARVPKTVCGIAGIEINLYIESK